MHMETNETFEVMIQLPGKFRRFKESCDAIGLSFENVATTELVTNLNSIIAELEQGSNPEGPFMDSLVALFWNKTETKPGIKNGACSIETFPAYKALDAWLRKEFSWTFIEWLDYRVNKILDPANSNVNEMIAYDLQEKFPEKDLDEDKLSTKIEELINK
jgi:hypothetical protein